MNINLFDFNLPENLIAQHPTSVRDQSRLLVVNKTTKTVEHKKFFDILNYLRPGDVLVRNNTKVIPARLIGIKKGTGAHVELLLLKQITDVRWECLVGNAKAVKIGVEIEISPKLKCVCVEVKEEGIRIVDFSFHGLFLEVLQEVGLVPLPPYIKEHIVDEKRYQTVYAKVNGSAAGPTAGFHFTDELFKKIISMGVEVLEITLHIGLGTFRPVKVEDTALHHMHFEEYSMSKEVSGRLNLAKQEKRRIIAIGTTSTRALEANFRKYGQFTPTKESTDIFIYPGIHFQAISALITNFHLPKSTLIMLVSAFAGREFILDVYRQAIEKEYRFFSFGDAMFIYE